MAGVMRRAPREAASHAHDLVVVGGGIYGSFAALEAARIGLRTVLVEKDDFGGATSWNSLKILHGGLRYLQTMDLGRFRESVRAREEILLAFPEHVERLPCLMPLYGEGLHRPAVLKAVLAANDALVRLWTGSSGRSMTGGRVLGPEETAERIPGVRSEGLRGAALWHDAIMKDAPRLLMEVLRRAEAAGATCLNYVPCGKILHDGERARGVRVTDRVTGAALEIEAAAVLNCTGPWSDLVAADTTDRTEPIFRPSIAFNVMLDRPPPSNAAVAVRPPEPGSRTYFLVPWRGRMLAGTFHAPCAREDVVRAVPTDEQMGRFLSDLDRALPGLRPDRASVLRVYAGLLPAARPGTEHLARRPAIVDHGARGGLRGFWSLAGIKYTTANLVTRHVVGRIAAALPDGHSTGLDRAATPTSGSEPESRPLLTAEEVLALADRDEPAARALLSSIVEEEAVVCIEDLVLRRMSWGEDSRDAERIAALARRLLGDSAPAAAEPGSGIS